MWVLKFKIKEEDAIYSKRTLKFGINILFYSKNFYEKGKKYFFINSGIVQGEEENKKKFFLDLKKDKKIEKLEINGDFFISVYSEPKKSFRSVALKTVYNSKIIFLKPVIINEEGWEEWEIASFDRFDLEDILKVAEKLSNTKIDLKFFREQKIRDLMVYSSMPDLTDRQKQAFLLAFEKGYYGYPRKVKLEKLAKLMDVSISTFQFHLAKAEGKLMPFFSKKLR